MYNYKKDFYKKGMSGMELLFKPLKMTEALVGHLLEWYNDEEIYPFLHPNFEETEHQTMTADEIKSTMIGTPGKTRYIIYDGELPIGEVSIIDDFPYLSQKEPKSAWIAICVGNKSYWGKGVAQKAMAFLEDTCRSQGYKRIELGVFENNVKARRLYAKLGYKEINIYPKFTYYNGEWYDDIRMDKYL